MKQVLPLVLLLLFAAPAFCQNSFRFLEDEAEENVNISFQVAPSATGNLTLVFDFRDKDNFYALDCAPGKIALRSLIAGVSHKLAESKYQWRSENTVVIQRRSWLMRVVVNGEVLLTGYDETLREGRIGFSGTWKWSAPRVQPVEAELYFNDDFTRAPGEGSEWKTASGNWQLTASSDRITQSNQAMSANPFSFQSKEGSTPALAHAGRAFWDNYDAQVSVRPAAQGTIGLAFYVQDAKNYLAFLWDSKESATARRLVKVENGQSRILTSAAGAFLPRQWYRLGVRTSPGFIETFLDGAPALRARDNSFGQGSMGLYSLRTTANFDDVRVRAYPYFRQDFSGPTGGAWTPVGGFWRATGGVLNSAPKPGDGGATRMLLAGAPEWENYELTASGRAGDAGSCGLVVGFQNDKNYTVFRWAGAGSTLPFKGRAQLLRYHNGSAKILSDAPLPAPGDDGFLRAKLRFAGGAITVFVRDEIVAQAADETLQSGRVGLWVQGAPLVSFRDVVMFLPPEADPPKVAASFATDELMVGWASAAGEWPSRPGNRGLEFWNTGEFFGDAQIEYTWRAGLAGQGAVEWALRANGGEFKSGYVLRAEGKDVLKLTLSRGEQILKTAEAAIKGAATVSLKIDLEGRAILVSVGGKPVLSYLPEANASVPEGTRLAARAEKATLLVGDLRAFSANRDDYTFSEAPTDWYAPSGDWSVFSRWPCYSDWSFFGGAGQSPILWSKREYSEDIVAEMYVHPQMDLPKDIGYSHPGDLNITLCGDGKTASSGYSFVLAGWSNTKSAIFKNATIVAQKAGPHELFNRPINTNPTFHRRWYYVRVEARRAEQNGKDGVQLRFLLDNQLLAEHFDPQPLASFHDGGRVAFWTLDGAMMIARAKIESQVRHARSLPAGLPDAGANANLAVNANPGAGNNQSLVPRAVLQNGLPSATISADGDDSYRITDPTGGGIFSVALQYPGNDDSRRISGDAKFEADFVLPPEAKVDFYFTIDGTRHLVELTGAQRADASTPRLGAATLAASAATTGKNWRRATFYLGAALKAKYPQSSFWALEKIEIGALHGDPYRWQGFSGNPLGVSYLLKDARLSEN